MNMMVALEIGLGMLLATWLGLATAAFARGNDLASVVKKPAGRGR